MNPSLAAAGKPALLQRWDPRLKIIALLLLAFSFSSVTDLRAIPVMIAVTLFFWAFSGLALRTLLSRLRYPSLLIVLLALVLLFAGGTTPLARFGLLTVSLEGLHTALLVVARFFCILLLALMFFAGAPLLLHVRALRALGLPAIMADMALLMVRYLEVVTEELQRMRRSMRLRGGRSRCCRWQTVRTTSWLIGTLLLHSYERSEGVYKAMRLRGYGHGKIAPVTFSATLTDVAALFAVVVVALGLLWLGS
jgi:cobalt/nickel transport system permease protein